MTSTNQMFLDDPVADLHELINTARHRKATRLLILAGKPIVCRIDGKLSEPILPGPTHFSQSERLVQALITPEENAVLDKDGEVEILVANIHAPAGDVSGLKPVRINIFYGDAAHNLIVFLD